MRFVGRFGHGRRTTRVALADAHLVDQLAQQLLALRQRQRLPARDQELQRGVARAAALGGGGVVLGAPFGVAQLFFDLEALFGQRHALGAQAVAALLLARRGLELLAEAPVDLLQAVAQAPCDSVCHCAITAASSPAVASCFGSISASWRRTSSSSSSARCVL